MDPNIEVNFRLESWPNHPIPICNKGSGKKMNPSSVLLYLANVPKFQLWFYEYILFLARPQFRLNAFGLWRRRRLVVSKRAHRWCRAVDVGVYRQLSIGTRVFYLSVNHISISIVMGFGFCNWSSMICELHLIKFRVSLYFVGIQTQGYTLAHCSK